MAARFTTIQETPAVTYVSLNDQAKNVYDGETFTIGTDLKFGDFEIGSVITSAIKYNECPLKAVETAKERGHELYYAIALGVTITAHKREKERLIVLELGDVITYLGKRFAIVEANNRNIHLQEVE